MRPGRDPAPDALEPTSSSASRQRPSRWCWSAAGCLARAHPLAPRRGARRARCSPSSRAANGTRGGRRASSRPAPRGNERELELAALAEHAQRHRRADLLDDHQSLDVGHVGDRLAVELDAILGAEAGGRGRRVVRDLHDLDAGVASEPTPDPAEAVVASRPRCRGRRAGSGLRSARRRYGHRDREAEADAGNRRVDPDHLRRPSASAPPDFPGFNAASVWITLSAIPAARRRQRAPRARHHGHRAGEALGLPIATTSWPTSSPSASPSSAATRSSASARSTARSMRFRPTAENASSRPSTKEEARGVSSLRPRAPR